MKKIFYLLILLFSLSSCFMSKTVRLAKKGAVVEKHFDKTIPFEYIKDYIVIEVSIQNRPFHFVFDTGAFVSALDKKSLEGIALDVKSHSKIGSSSGKAQKTDMVLINELNIGGIRFQNTGAVLLDMSESLNALGGCYHIDGVLGNNVMRKANWQIDYENKKIRFTDDMTNFSVSKEAYSYKMNPKKWGNTRLPVTIEGVQKYYTFDTGFGGLILSSYKYLEQVKEKNPNTKTALLKNELGFDLYGEYTKDSQRAIAKSITIGDYQLTNKLVRYRENGSSLVGNKFFEHFLLTIDSDHHQLLLDSISDFKADSLEVFELMLRPDYRHNQIKVVAEWADHPLKDSIPSGVPILKIEGHDVAHLTKEELCDFWDNTWVNLIKKKKITIETAEGKRVLTKKLLLF